jgi:riboflavin kinase/FMN adenylyltransferase
LSPQEFVEKILVQGLHDKWLIVGEDFCYGSKRAGNVATLIEAGKQYGFQVESQPTVTSSGARISSSAVRSALAQGDFAEAEVLLGHPYSMSGHVIHGKKLGRTIGFPTLNLRVGHKHPALSGIYVVQVHGLADEALPGVASIGVRPTVDDSGRVLLETHLFDYNQQYYGRLISVEFLKKLRDEEKYIDMPTLTAAIERDAVQARTYFKQIADSATSATDRI